MSIIGTRHIKVLRERLEFLNSRIEESDGPVGYETKEVRALEWALQELDDGRTVVYSKEYKLGQKNLLKFYQKTLQKAVHSGNVEALQFLLDKTNKWLEEKGE